MGPVRVPPIHEDEYLGLPALLGNQEETVPMKKKDIIIGETYIVKVSGKLAHVYITNESPYGGWDGLNITTKRAVRIKSAARLRRRADPLPDEEKAHQSSAPLWPRSDKQTEGWIKVVRGTKP